LLAELWLRFDIGERATPGTALGTITDRDIPFGGAKRSWVGCARHLAAETTQREMAMRAAVYREPERPIRKCIPALLVLSGSVLLLVGAFALVQTGFRLGRSFNDPSALDAAARIGIAPDTSYPCGVEIPCYEKGRYQPIWL
jgi:hypothetical protein